MRTVWDPGFLALSTLCKDQIVERLDSEDLCLSGLTLRAGGVADSCRTAWSLAS